MNDKEKGRLQAASEKRSMDSIPGSNSFSQQDIEDAYIKQEKWEGEWND